MFLKIRPFFLVLTAVVPLAISSSFALAPESQIISFESDVGAVLKQWVEQWRASHRILEKIRITHQIHPGPNSEKPGEILLKGELTLILQTIPAPTRLAVIRYRLAPGGKFHVFYRETDHDYRRKKLMTLLNLYLFSRFDCQTVSNDRTSDDGEAFLNGQRRQGILSWLYVTDEDAIGIVHSARVQELSLKISTLFSQLETSL